MQKTSKAHIFAKKKHQHQLRKDCKTPYWHHLKQVVQNLQKLGIKNQDILCAGWLHDTIEDTDTSFDDLFEQFGRIVAVLVSSLSKDTSLPKKKREQEYVKQLKEASFGAKLIKLCDISANLSDLKNYDASKSKRLRYLRQKRHYLVVIKNDLIANTDYPKITTLLESINQILKRFGQRPISLQSKS